jgi:polyisoprenyl-phosphate glycosyltransferase
MAVSDCFVSVVAPLRNDSTIVADFVAEVMDVLRANYTNYELVLVDDGSDDDTVAEVTSLLGRYECIRLIRLSRKFGTEIAIASGIDSVIGDFVVVMLPDTDPPRLMPDMVRQARNGQGIVFGVRKSRAGEPFLMRVATDVFYWAASKLFQLRIPKDSTKFLVLSRQAVNAVTQIKDRYRYIRVLSAYVGYSNQTFVYEPINRYGRPRTKGFLEAVNLAVGIIVTNSTHPLRFVSWLGFIAGALNVLYGAYVIAVYLFRSHVAEGWTTVSLQASCMFFFVFLILTVLSEYVGHILEESRERPLYYVLEERNSSVLLADQERRNVVNASLQPEPTTQRN